jgi:microcystin-dependent protein
MKGDLEALGDYDATQVVNRLALPVGSNGEVLTADSTADAGLSWQVPGAAAMPAGTIVMYGAANGVPAGWLECNGQAVSRTTYLDLFNFLSTAWGSGDGSTTFNLPDLRGRCPIGAGTGVSLTPRTFASLGGSEGHALTVAELPAHDHTMPGRDNATSFASNRPGYAAGGSINDTRTTGSAGSGAEHSSMQPYAAIRFIVKT